ncbi:MAG TPA: alpha/beta hydrolase [Symbiobacteriaceae bacterium]|nr:alpha/beta hydrolase [Symbiobacteriaceae bacterium]
MGVGRSGGGWTQAPLRSGGSAQVSGVDLYYEASGPEFGPTVLFLHESGGSVATWEEQLRHLGSEVRCLALDMPGHGRSAGSPVPSVQAYREWILGFLEALAIRQKISVVGLGLGAAIALDLAVVRPERVYGLVLTGGVPGGRASDRARDLVSQGETHTAFDEELLRHIPSATVRMHWQRRWQKATPACRTADLTAAAQYEWSAGLDRASCPILFLEGALDPHATIWRRARGRLVLIPGSGGLAPLEQPARYAAGVRDFLTTLQTPTDGRAISRFG